MPPKRAIKKAKVRTQTFLEPYMFRPIPISLSPVDIEVDMELMNALLVAQRHSALQPSAAWQSARGMVLPESPSSTSASPPPHALATALAPQPATAYAMAAEAPAFAAPALAPVPAHMAPSPASLHEQLVAAAAAVAAAAQRRQQQEQEQERFRLQLQQQLQLLAAQLQLQRGVAAAALQQAQQSVAPPAQPHSVPTKLASPSCTFQHQQALAAQQAAGYALA